MSQSAVRWRESRKAQPPKVRQPQGPHRDLATRQVHGMGGRRSKRRDALDQARAGCEVAGPLGKPAVCACGSVLFVQTYDNASHQDTSPYLANAPCPQERAHLDRLFRRRHWPPLREDHHAAFAAMLEEHSAALERALQVGQVGCGMVKSEAARVYLAGFEEGAQLMLGLEKRYLTGYDLLHCSLPLPDSISVKQAGCRHSHPALPSTCASLPDVQVSGR